MSTKKIHRMTLNVSSEGRETLENNSSAEFNIRIPVTTRPFHIAKLMHMELPETRRAVRADSVLCIEQPIHLEADATVTVTVGSDTYVLHVPATLKTLVESAALPSDTWDVSAGENGLNLSWPETVYVVSGEDAGQEPTAVSTTRLSVGTSISSAKLWHPPILPSQLVRVIGTRLTALLSSASATIMIQNHPETGQVRLYSNRTSSVATIEFSSELSQALLGQGGSVLMAPGESQLFTPKQQFMQMPPGTFTPVQLLSYTSMMSGMSLSTTTAVATVTLSNGETRTVTMLPGFYHGTRLANAFMVRLGGLFAETDTLATAFSTTTGKFTLAADAAFTVVFASNAFANAFGFNTTVLAGSAAYTSPYSTFTGEDGLGLVLQAAYYDSIKQAALTPLAAPTVYMSSGINPTTFQDTQVNVDGTTTTAVHGFKVGDVVVIRKVGDGTELMDTVASVGDASTVFGASYVNNTQLKSSVVTHATSVAVAVRLANQVSRAKVVLNSGAAAVRSVGGKHDMHVQLGLARVLTDVFGSTTMPRVMVTAPPTTLAVELLFANSSVISENLVWRDGATGDGDSKRMFCTVQARQQETFVTLSEELRVAELRWAEKETLITVRILDVRDMKLVDFGNGPVRVSIALATTGMEDAIV